MDNDTLHRSKRKMEEKARLYAAMKRGDYVGNRKRGVNDDREALVDFDRKWAEDEDGEKNYDTTSDDGGDGEEDEATVEFTDEFGRRRMGKKSEIEREDRRKRVQAIARRELGEMSARPENAPENLIYGDTIQSAAFNPDAAIETKMRELAAKRDRSLTPPPEVHYDASKEIRTKGVGFYQFSGDNETRAKEMESLQAERAETDKRAKEREERKLKKQKELEERRRKVKEMRGAKEADKFLKDLNVSFIAEGTKEN